MVKTPIDIRHRAVRESKKNDSGLGYAWLEMEYPLRLRRPQMNGMPVGDFTIQEVRAFPAPEAVVILLRMVKLSSSLILTALSKQRKS